MSEDNIARAFIADAKANFKRLQSLGDAALEQLDNNQFFHQIDPVSNSVAVIVKHLAGNMSSRWRDFLTTDGEKPDRNRPSEFVAESESREQIMARLDRGWQTLFATIETLNDSDIMRLVTIRGEEHSVMEAINRQLIHYGVHVGQIILLAKHNKHESWQSVDTKWNRKMPGEFEIK